MLCLFCLFCRHQRVQQSLDAKHLRRLRQPLVSPAQRGGHPATGSAFQGVGQRQRQQPANRIVLASVDERLNLRGGDQAARCVVHQHPVIWLRRGGQQRLKAMAHGERTGGATLGQQHLAGPVEIRASLGKTLVAR